MALVIALNILLCNVTEDRTYTDTNVTDLITVAIIIIKVNTANTIKQVCREIDHHNNESSEFDVLLLLCTLFTTLRKTCSSRFTLDKI